MRIILGALGFCLVAAVCSAQAPVGTTGTVGSGGGGGAGTATISIGTVTTGAAGGNAAVINRGSGTAAILDFTLPRGANGATGSQGLTGSAGAQGAAGPAGAQGPAGLVGPAGPTGATGPQGSAGAQGVAGPAGGQGLTGLTGAAGVAGAAGPKGDKGDTGSTGATGPNSVTTSTSTTGTGVVYGNGSAISFKAIGITSGTVAAGDDSRFGVDSTARTAAAAAQSKADLALPATAQAADSAKLGGVLPSGYLTPSGNSSTTGILGVGTTSTGARSSYVQIYNGTRGAGSPDATIGFGSGSSWLELSNLTSDGYIRLNTTSNNGLWTHSPIATTSQFSTAELASNPQRTGVAALVSSMQTTSAYSQPTALWPVAANAKSSSATNSMATGMEVNTMERLADQGYMESRTGRATLGVQVVPESELDMGDGTGISQGYNGSFGLGFMRSSGVQDSGAGRALPSAAWHVPMLFDTDCTTHAGTQILSNGGSTALLAPNILFKAKGFQGTGIDLSAATFAGSAIKLAASQTFTDGTVTKTLAQLASGGAGALLKTNGTSNGSQSILNLTAGANTTLTDNGTGTIIIASSGSGGVVSVTGTTNQIIVTGTTTPTLSLPQSIGTSSTPQFGAIGAGIAASSSYAKVYAYASGSEKGINASTNSGNAVEGYSTSAAGVLGTSGTGPGGYFASGSPGVGSNGIQAKAYAAGQSGMYSSGTNDAYGIVALQDGTPTVSNTAYPTFLASRSYSSLGSFTVSAPVARINDDTASTGNLLQIDKQGVTKAIIDKTGNLTLYGGNATVIAEGANAQHTAQVYTASGGAPTFFGQAAGGTAASPSATPSGRVLFYLVGGGYGTTGWQAAAASMIQMTSAESYTDTAKGSDIRFQTSTLGGAGTSTRAERMRIHPSGGVSVGNTVDPGAGNLSVSGTLTATSEILAQSTSSTVNTSLFGGANSVASNSISITGVVLGTYFDFELSGAGTPTVTTATCNWMGATPAAITSGKSSSFFIKGTGPNAGRCYILRENY